jgi:predicted RNA-binding protein YlxR (DUF448 family)
VSKRGHIPIRMCIGCRKRMKKDEMVRWICGPEGGMVRGGHQPRERGFYLCPNLVCLKVAQRKWGSFVDVAGKCPVSPPLKAGSQGTI